MQSPKQLANCIKRAETGVVLIVFDGTLCDVRAYTVTVFFTVAQHELCTRKTIYWSVTVYSKNLSSQCHLTAQIGPYNLNVSYRI